VIALGQLPLHHPLVPALHFDGAIPRQSSPAETISGLSTATVGSTLTFGGPAPSGTVLVQGSYDGGRTWTTLASVDTYGGSYSATVTLEQRGDLSIKITYANGSTATGSVAVR
jgi:hypothetical protein